MIISTPFIPQGFQAMTVWPFIFVLPQYRLNEGLIQHELVHYREQAWITPIWLLRYWLSKSFRLSAEVRAYRHQILIGGISIGGAADMLLLYHLDITQQQAYQLLVQ
jgi:hypothetical protein